MAVREGPPRRREHDWLRGVAVLLMIDAHLFDSWTRFPDRETRAFGLAMIIGGAGTTLFLFLAGVASRSRLDRSFAEPETPARLRGRSHCTGSRSLRSRSCSGFKPFSWDGRAAGWIC